MSTIPTISDRCFNVFSHGSHLNSACCVFFVGLPYFQKSEYRFFLSKQERIFHIGINKIFLNYMQDTWEPDEKERQPSLSSRSKLVVSGRRYQTAKNKKAWFDKCCKLLQLSGKTGRSSKKRGCWREITGRGEGAFFSRKQSILRVKTCVRAVIGRG